MTAQSGSLRKSVEITIKAAGIKITAPQSIKAGQSVTLKAEGYGVSGSVQWKVSNKSIASISKSGVLKGQKAGTVQVTAKIKNYSDTVTIRVK